MALCIGLHVYCIMWLSLALEAEPFEKPPAPELLSLNLRPIVSDQIQQEAALGLVQRILKPHEAEMFKVSVSSQVYESIYYDYGFVNIEDNGTLHIFASSGS